MIELAQTDALPSRMLDGPPVFVSVLETVQMSKKGVLYTRYEGIVTRKLSNLSFCSSRPMLSAKMLTT